MNDRDPIGTEQERALWARLKASAPAAEPARLPPVFDDELAAWLDGRLPPDAAARVEARLAADPKLLDLALDTAGALREAAHPAPDRLVTRAQALVGFEADRQVRGGGGLLAWLGGWRRQLELTAVAGAFVIVCGTGFSLGGGLQQAYADDRINVVDVLADAFADGESGFLGDLGGQQ